ncbi:MAG: putative Ig domain-containing protein [Cyanobacteria bacterium MAG CAR2_bin_4]|nr:putative Ig domain-containing protein [Cyanobacteria bacterium MAG CAR2_bin_4]
MILTLSSRSGYNVGSASVHTLTITDNDTAALVFSPTSVTVAEGASGSYTVKLATLPTGNVTVTVGGASGEVTVDTNPGSPGNQTTLSFTTTTWNTAQTVTVVAGQDDDTTNDSATLTHAATGGGYNSVTGNVAVTITDNDTAALVFSPTSVTVAEGASGSYTVKLATLPTGNVTVTVGGASGEVTVDTNPGSPGNQTTLSFTTTTWNTAQTVTVVAGQDDDTTNDSATLTHAATGGGYNSVTGNVAVTVTDATSPNKAPTVATAIADQSATAGTTFSYAFPANTFTDADNDTLGYTASKGDDTALPTWLTFTEASRTFSGTPQSADVGALAVKVTADDGNGGSVSDTFNIVVSAATPTTPTVSFAAARSSVAENGGTRNVALSISPSPTASITVNYTVTGSATEDTDFSITGSGTVTVAANTGSVTIPVAVTDDSVDENGETVILTLSSGSGYNVGSASVHTLTITDNDGALHHRSHRSR